MAKLSQYDGSSLPPSSLPPPPVKKSGCSKFLIVLFVLFLAGGLMAMQDLKTPSKPTDKLVKTLKLTEEQAQEMRALFDACGIGEIERINMFQSGDDDASYYVFDTETAFYRKDDKLTFHNRPIVIWITHEDKVVEAIYYNDNTIYKDGEHVSDLTLYYVNKEMRSISRSIAEELVTSYLSVSNNVQFGTSWKWEIEDSEIVVSGTASYKNASDTTLKRKFEVRMDALTQQPTSVVINDIEYLK